VFCVHSANVGIVKIPKPKEEEDSTTANVENKAESELPLPQTLVRIPTEHAPMLQQPSGGGNAEP
jgi:DASH complex subunit DAD2